LRTADTSTRGWFGDLGGFTRTAVIGLAERLGTVLETWTMLGLVRGRTRHLVGTVVLRLWELQTRRSLQVPIVEDRPRCRLAGARCFAVSSSDPYETTDVLGLRAQRTCRV
jgi:hypothetical protein